MRSMHQVLLQQKRLLSCVGRLYCGDPGFAVHPTVNHQSINQSIKWVHSEFQVAGAATATARRPYVFSWKLGATSKLRLAVRRCCRSATWAT